MKRRRLARAEIGTHFPEREQPPLSAEERKVVDRFHELYYHRWLSGAADTVEAGWFGHQLRKCPMDLWIYQELLVRQRPDIVIETGTWRGGSAYFLAMMLDLLGHGEVVSVDAEAIPDLPQHRRITYLTGSSTAPEIVREVTARAAGRRTFVILDSDHRREHVLAELRAYAPLIAVGDVLVVEDTNVGGHPAWPEFGPGPMEAVDEFLAEAAGRWAVDERCERFLMTLNPRGYLRRLSAA